MKKAIGIILMASCMAAQAASGLCSLDAKDFSSNTVISGLTEKKNPLDKEVTVKVDKDICFNMSGMKQIEVADLSHWSVEKVKVGDTTFHKVMPLEKGLKTAVTMMDSDGKVTRVILSSMSERMSASYAAY